MAKHAGDNGQHVESRVTTMHVDGAVDAGAVVEINGQTDGFTQVTPSGSVIDGITAESTSGAGKVPVVVHGDVWTRDDSGLSAGDTVGDGDSDSSGHITDSAGTEYDVWLGQEADADGNNVSLVYLD